MRHSRRWHRPVDRLRVAAERLSADGIALATPQSLRTVGIAAGRAALAQALSEQHGWPWTLALALGMSPWSVNLHLLPAELTALSQEVGVDLKGCTTLADCWERLGVL